MWCSDLFVLKVPPTLFVISPSVIILSILALISECKSLVGSLFRHWYVSVTLRIDTSGWSANFGALFCKVWISCFLKL